MANNEQTSDEVAAIAAKALRTGKATQKEIRKLAGSVLTQVPDNDPKPQSKRRQKK